MLDESRCTVPARAHLRSVNVLMPHPLPPGSQASESLLTRARCYALLGQRKTAMFDFNSVLRAEPGNVQALCARALLHLALDQQKVPGPPSPGPEQGEWAALGEALPSSSLPEKRGSRVRPSCESPIRTPPPGAQERCHSPSLGSSSLPSAEPRASQPRPARARANAQGYGGPQLQITRPRLPAVSGAP